jgi:cryptochrome
MAAPSVVFWFRKGLRLKDNKALVRALEEGKKRNASVCYPIFVLDPHFGSAVGSNRWRFLMESLDDLNSSLMKLDSRLLVIRGSPEETIPSLLKKWNVQVLGFEVDSEPYALKRDANIEKVCTKAKVHCVSTSGHTLFDLETLKTAAKLKEGDWIKAYRSMTTLIDKMGPPEVPLDEPTVIPSLPEGKEFLDGLESE